MKISEILAKYRVSPDDRLGSGMEAAVYVYGVDQVLKVYTDTTTLEHLQALKVFYDGLDRDAVAYALPRILSIRNEAEAVVTVETRLYGTPMSDILPGLDSPALDAMMQATIAATQALSEMTPSTLDGRYQLFDTAGLSTNSGDWHRFLARTLMYRLTDTGPYLARDVDGFAEKVARIQAWLEQPYTGTLRLVHGDICPSNLLVDATGAVTALLDFGLLTMVGDPFFDLATSWVFFDMYDELKANVRARYLAMLIDTFGEDARSRLYRYVLLYSMISANTYAPACDDGHYAWCVENLNNVAYWQAV